MSSSSGSRLGDIPILAKPVANVPEGRCDRSLARSAHRFQETAHDEISLGLAPIIPCPTGRCFEGYSGTSCQATIDPPSDDRISLGFSCALAHTVPLRDGAFDGRFSRHFVPGYDRLVLPGQKVLFSEQDVT